MKKLVCVFLAVLTAAMLFGCSAKTEEGTVRFEQVVNENVQGLGVEWDAYEHPDVITEEKWERATAYMDKLSPAYIRCVINLDWVVTNWNKGASEDVSDDTWEYNWEQSSIRNMFKILDHCQKSGIRVGLGVWRPVDGWDMQDSSDVRFAKIMADIAEELIVSRGYSCIFGLFLTNEPNYLPGNDFQKWSTGVKNTAAELAARGLSDKVSIIGPDATSYSAAITWCEDTVKNVKEHIGNYSIHMYVSDYSVDSGRFAEDIRDVVNTIEKEDKDFDKKGLIIWESGLLDGKDPEWDTNVLIDTFGFGVRMADYTMQAIMGGASGVSFWEFDDAMHFLENGQMKQYGMFSSLGTAAQQELRPWFQSSYLLTRLFAPQSKVYGCSLNSEKDTTLRALASVSSDGKTGGYCVVNRGYEEAEETFFLPQKVQGEKLYVYIFGEKDMKLGADGFIVPNYELDGSLNGTLTLKIPAGSAVFVTNTKY